MIMEIIKKKPREFIMVRGNQGCWIISNFWRDAGKANNSKYSGDPEKRLAMIDVREFQMFRDIRVKSKFEMIGEFEMAMKKTGNLGD